MYLYTCMCLYINLYIFVFIYIYIYCTAEEDYRKDLVSVTLSFILLHLSDRLYIDIYYLFVEVIDSFFVLVCSS